MLEATWLLHTVILGLSTNRYQHGSDISYTIIALEFTGHILCFPQRIREKDEEGPSRPSVDCPVPDLHLSHRRSCRPSYSGPAIYVWG